MTTKSYPIPKPLWDAIENILSVKSKELIKDIAKTLHQPEKPLLDAFKAKKHTFHLVDMEEPTGNKFECEALVCTTAVAHRCRKPVLLGQTRCPEHEFCKQPTLGAKPILTRLKTDDGDIYFVDSLMNVYTENFERVGSFQDGVLTLFELEDEEEFA
jgi:hypothetical protein